MDIHTTRQGTTHEIKGDYIEVMKKAIKLLKKNKDARFQYTQVIDQNKGTLHVKDGLIINIYIPDRRV